MKRVPLIAILLLCGGGAALAQVESPPEVTFRATYDRRPDGEDFASNYPGRAADTAMPGITVLCCTPNDNQTLACNTAIEWPRDQGFGAASLKMSERYRLTKESFDHFRSNPEERVEVRINWNFNPIPKQYEDAYRTADARIRESTKGICKTTAPTS